MSKRKEKLCMLEFPLNVTTKDGQLVPEMKKYIHEWVKENSDRINKPIFERIFGNKK